MTESVKSFKLRKIIAFQVMLGLVLSLLLLGWGVQAFFSCLAAVVLATAVNLCLLLWYFFGGTQDPSRVVLRLYSGEIFKILILALAIIFLAHTFDLKWWAFILGLVVIQLSYCVIPYFMYKKGTVDL